MPMRMFALVLVALSFSLPSMPRHLAPVRSGFTWPLDPPVTVTRRFEPPPDPYKAGHRGADLLGVAGARVRSAGTGVVAFAGLVAGRPVVSVSHPGGLRTTYEPVDAVVRAGTVVGAGTPLGVLRAGHAGCPAPACLHWGLRAGDVYLDPLSLLRRGRVRLLPVSGPEASAGPRRGAGSPPRGCRPAPTAAGSPDRARS
ncbi:peptidoglycan DD-metalloendopeptidase family protein [Dactylosporangium siamense]|uniref:peptidoglycan DD-metalloendopeptidase family protein n=1 Tax=Dactylosporangium siamense TaxID=685454 RepID=UPI003571451D